VAPIAKVLLPVSGDLKPVPVTPGVIDKNAESAYCYGQCLALALALRETGGYPLVLSRGWLAEDQLDEDYNERLDALPLVADLFVEAKGGSYQQHYDSLEQAIYEETGRAVHYSVLLPGQKYMDITGVHILDEFLQLPHLFNARVEDLHVLSEADQIPEPGIDDDMETARSMAESLVNLYGDSFSKVQDHTLHAAKC